MEERLSLLEDRFRASIVDLDHAMPGTRLCFFTVKDQWAQMGELIPKKLYKKSIIAVNEGDWSWKWTYKVNIEVNIENWFKKAVTILRSGQEMCK